MGRSCRIMKRFWRSPATEKDCGPSGCRWRARRSHGEIWTASRVIKLPEIKGIGLGDADVTVAGDQIWLVYRTNQGLFQQRFNLDGSRADDQATRVAYQKAGNGNGRGDWVTIGAMTMLTFLILIA